MNFIFLNIIFIIFILFALQCKIIYSKTDVNKFMDTFQEHISDLKWIRDQFRQQRSTLSDKTSLNKLKTRNIKVDNGEQYDNENVDSWYNNFRFSECTNNNNNNNNNNNEDCNNSDNEITLSDNINSDAFQYTNEDNILKDTIQFDDNQLYKNYEYSLNPYDTNDFNQYLNASGNDNNINEDQINLNENSNGESYQLSSNKHLPFNLQVKQIRSITNDQIEKTRNDLSHEANYKLSKIEQDNMENKRSNNNNNNNNNNNETITINEKRNLNTATNEIKLKISNKLQAKGMGSSLPSDSFNKYYRYKSIPAAIDYDLIKNDKEKNNIENHNLFKRATINNVSNQFENKVSLNDAEDDNVRNNNNNVHNLSTGRKLLQLDDDDDDKVQNEYRNVPVGGHDGEKRKKIYEIEIIEDSISNNKSPPIATNKFNNKQMDNNDYNFDENINNNNERIIPQEKKKHIEIPEKHKVNETHRLTNEIISNNKYLKIPYTNNNNYNGNRQSKLQHNNVYNRDNGTFIGADKSSSSSSSPSQINIKLEININATTDHPKNIQHNNSIKFNYNGKRETRYNKRNHHFSNKLNISHKNDLHLNDMMSGKLSNELVLAIYQLVNSNANFRYEFGSHFNNNNFTEYNNPEKTMNTYKNQNNSEKIENTEKMLGSVMATITDLIEEQVNQRVCVPLRPDLQEFYDHIILSNHKNNNKNHRSFKTSANQDLDETEYDADEEASTYNIPKRKKSITKRQIHEKHGIVKKLLNHYEKLPMDDKLKMINIKEFIQQHIQLLDEIERSVVNRNSRQTQNLEVSKLQTSVADDISHKYKKLSNTVDFIKKNSLFDTEHRLRDIYKDYENFQEYSYDI